MSVSVAALARRALPAVALLSLVAAPAAAGAQGPWTFEPFATRHEQSTSPLLGGISFAKYDGPIGVRFSGALNFDGRGDSARVGSYGVAADCRRGPCGTRTYRGGDDGFGMPTIGAWSADADLIFAPVRAVAPLRMLLLGFSPYAFAGVGGYGVKPRTGADTSRATWSLGAGAHHDLIGALGVSGEARYRQAFNSDSGIPRTWQEKLEYRVGLTISFGGGGGRKRRGREATTHEPRRTPMGPCGAAPCPPDAAPPERIDPNVGARAVEIAARYIDAPYRGGGSSPSEGFDAAGFVQYVFGQAGATLPRDLRRLSTAGSNVALSVGTLRPGDLVFFANDRTNIDHVAIYVGRDQIVHATSSGGGVRYDVLGEGERGKWFSDHLVAARRLGAP